MDRVLAILLIIVLSAGLFAGCTAKSPEPEPEPTKKPEPKPALDPDGPIDGGVIDNSDPNAPKSINSTEILSFSCQFSTLGSRARNTRKQQILSCGRLGKRKRNGRILRYGMGFRVG